MIAGLKVLLIEDNAADAELIDMLLSEAGREQFLNYTLKRAESLADGVRALGRESFSVVLLDLGLPDSSGLETLLRIEERAHHIPVIALTGLADEEFAARAISIGAQDYLVKGKITGDSLYRSVLYSIERKKSELLLEDSEERFRAFFELSGMGALQADPSTGRFVMVNRSFCELTGYSRDELLSLSFREITHPDDWPEDLSEYGKLLCGKMEQYDREVRYLHKQGHAIWVHVSRTLLRKADGHREPIRVLGIVHDITDRKRMEQEIIEMAHHDALTGLPNRRLFIELAQIEMAQANRNNKKMAFVFLDLDRFKEVNDTFGHEAGDQLLKEVALRIKKSLRKSDTIARIGGDEFNIIIADLARAEGSAEIARKIVESFRAPFLIAGHELHVTASIGLSVYPDDDQDMETLFRYADIAMYHAKETGKNNFQFYNPSINVHSAQRIKMESGLRQAIANGELLLYYQPLADIRTGKMVCAEALVRWNHPEMGLLEPKDFIPMAEETGFITTIDEWVLEAVCRQAKLWRQAGLPPVCLTVNLSSRIFQKTGFASSISRVLQETGLPPGILYLEITETLAMENIQLTASQLAQLSELGVQISIDDFGTGYSSLNYLKRLPIGRLKIDRSFIKDIATDPDDRAIINAVVAMAHNMKMKVIAEGVETESQLDFLRQVGCDEMQGFLYSRPLTAEKFVELAGNGNKADCGAGL